MKKITSLFCLLIVSILSYAVNEVEIKTVIEATSDVEVDVINDSIHPWGVISGTDSLYNPVSGGTITLVFETDYITTLTYNVLNYSSDIYVDGIYVDKYSSGVNIPAGRHEISIKSISSKAIVEGLSIKKLCTNEDIKATIEATSDVKVDVINDSIYPWGIISGTDSLYNPISGGTITLVFETDYITELTCTSRAGTSIYVDGTMQKAGEYIPAGEHEISIKSIYNNAIIKGLSIKKVCSDADIEVLIESNSDVDVTVINDSIYPWIIMGKDTIGNHQPNAKFSITYSSNKTTRFYFEREKSDRVYIDNIEYPATLVNGYLFAGTHTITFVSNSDVDKRRLANIINFSIHEIEDAMEPIILKSSHAITNTFPKHYYDYNDDGVLEPILDGGYGISINFTDGSINRTQAVSLKNSEDDSRVLYNFNNDEYIDMMYIHNSEVSAFLSQGHSFQNPSTYTLAGSALLDYNNDGYPDFVKTISKQAKNKCEANTIYNNGVAQSYVNLYALDAYIQEQAQQQTANTQSSSAIKYAKLLAPTNVADTIQSQSKRTPKKVIKANQGLTGMGTAGLVSAGLRGALSAAQPADMSLDVNGDGIVDYVKHSITVSDIGTGMGGITLYNSSASYLNMENGNYICQGLSGDFIDLNSDGIMDIIGHDGSDVVYYLLQPDGTYQKNNFNIEVQHNEVWCYDFDKDGDKDILLAYNYHKEWDGSFLIMLENQGNGQYGYNEFFYSERLYKPTCIDYDNDGYYEIIWLVDLGSNGTAEDICHLNVDGMMISESLIYWNINDFNYDYKSNSSRYGYTMYNIIDSDNDGSLELWVSLDKTSNREYNVMYMKLTNTVNAKPDKPQAPRVVYESSTEQLAISWDLGSDKETSPVDLTYALRIGSEPGKGDIVYAHAHSDGTRKNFLGGNMSTNRYRVLNTSTWKPGKYYVSIQAVDPNNRGSEFSEEVVFEKTSHATGFELMYDIEHFGVGDTCDVLLNPNVWLDTAAYVACTGGEVVGISADSLTLYVVFSKDGEQTISLCRRNANGSISTSCVKTIDVSPFHFTISKTMGTQVALDLNEDGFMEFYGIYEGESATTTRFHTYAADGCISRVNKMYNNNTNFDTYGAPFTTVDINKDGKVDVFAGTIEKGVFKAINTGNLNMSLNTSPLIYISPKIDWNNDGWFDSQPDNPNGSNTYYIYSSDSAYTSCQRWECPKPFMYKDVNSDGLEDIIYKKTSEKLSSSSTYIQYYILYTNNGDFTFTIKDTLCSTTDLEDGRLCLISDFDNDGSLDIVYRQYDSADRIKILWSDGTKTIVEGIVDVQCTPNGSLYEPGDYGVLDYNNDGYLDMLAETYGAEGYTYGVLLMLPNHEYKFVPTGYKFHTMEEGTRPYLTPEGNLLFTQTTYHVPNEFILKSANQRPAAPTNISAAQSEKGVMITWEHSQDAETPSARMRYNISVKHKGKTGEGAYLISPCNSTKNGVPVPSHLPLIEGNRFLIPTASIQPGEYEVQVQGVDLLQMQSDFSEVYDLVVHKSIAINAPAATGVGIETKVTIASNVATSIDWDGGKAIDTIGNQYIVVWDSIGMKTITAGEHTHTINVKPLPTATFVLPNEAMQLATIHGKAQNAREGKWEISTNGGKTYVPFSQSDVVEMLSVDTASIVLRFNKIGQYLIRHTIKGEFGNGVYEQPIQITGEHIAPEISIVTNIGGHYQVTWQQSKDMPSEVIGYRLYKETSYTDVYELVAELDKDSLMCIDVTSNPDVQSSRYALSYITTYGESMKGTPHQCLHVMINRGVGTTWNLAWMKYEGRDIATYRIWRGTTPDNLSVIGEISGNMTSYSDLMTGDSINYYAVEVIFIDNTPSSLPTRRLAPRSSGISAMSNIISTTSVNEVAFVEHINVQGEDIVAGISNTSQLYAYIQPYYASYKAVNWVITEGEDIAKISASGLLSVNGYTNGDVVVRAYALDGSNVYGETTINVRGFDDTFTITYIVDGEVIKTEKISYGSAIVAPESDKEGHHIVWYNLPEIMPTHDITVEGSYVINSYKITYIVDDEVYATDSLLYGATIELLPQPTKEGYTFSGWNDVPSTMPAHDVVVNGAFTINSYDVIYMVDGAEYKRVSVVYGAPIVLEAEPTKEGYTFSGWSEAPETMPAHDVVVEGSFTINKYLLTYMVEGNVFATDSIVYGAPIELIAAPEKEGYTFAWDHAPSTMPAHDVVVNGVFTINSYDVIYMVDGAEYNRVSVVYGAPIVLEAEPTKEGYTFSGWSEAPEIMPAHDVVVEGSFTINKYLLTYMVEGNVFATDSIVYGAPIELIAGPEKEGYTFAWDHAPSTMPAHDVVVNGVFTINSYDVIYMVDGAEYNRVSVVYGAPIVLEAEPTKEGYTFSGWSDVPETMPAHDVVVEGSFIVNYYALTYTVDNEWYATDSIAYGDVIELREEPTKEGYVFSGWSDVPETMPAHDVEVLGTFTPFTSVDNVTTNNANIQKMMRNGQLIILRNGVEYNAMGQEL